MPVCFLSESLRELTDEEKKEVVAFVIREVGGIKPTKQTGRYL